MKKTIIVLAISIFQLYCQGQSKLTTTDFQKSMVPGIQNEIPFPEKTIYLAIEDKLQKAGYKGKESKGYTQYKAVRIKEFGSETYDLYFRAERKSKKEKDVCVVTLLISTGFEKFLGDSTATTVLNNGKDFLNHLTEIVAAYDLEQQIAEQEEIVNKADKRLNNITDEGQDLQKKKAKLDRDISENQKLQVNQKSQVDKERQILDTLKSKRKQ